MDIIDLPLLPIVLPTQDDVRLAKCIDHYKER